MKKTKVLDSSQEQVAETASKCEQPRAELTLQCQYERVSFKPVDALEEVAHVGFVCERLSCSQLSDFLYRLSIENCKDNIEELPKALTPWMPAQDLSVALTGVMYLQPLLVREIKEKHNNAVNPE